MVATPRPHPPLPRLAFRVGVVGHRWTRLPRAAAPEVREAMARVLRTVRAAVVAAQGTGYRDDPPALRLVTALAEGADRLAAEAALHDVSEAGGPAYQLDLILPFNETAYRESFEHPAELPDFDRLGAMASRTLVMDGDPARYDAFVAGGRAVVDQSDLLVAVWDLGSADGAGGTANQVAYATREEVPIVVVDPSRPGLPWLYDPGLPDTGASGGLDGLPQAVHRLVAPPAVADLRTTYFAERQVRGHLGKAFRAVVAGNQAGVLPVLGWPGMLWGILADLARPDFREEYTTAARAEWLARWASPATLAPATLGRLADDLSAPFGWADRLATYYANRYRSSFTVIFGLSWMAVLFAFVGVQLHGTEGWGVAIAALEVAILALVFLVVARGRTGRFHERWLDYRALAERLRHLTFLWPVGRSSFLARHSRQSWDGDPVSDWTDWLVRAVVRDTGMPSGTVTAASLEGCRAFLRVHELETQAAYHEATAKALTAVEHRLHPQVELAFGVALVAAVAHLLPLLPLGLGEWHYPGWLSVLLAFATIVLPAFGAARHGFLGQADVVGTSTRAAALAGRLRELQQRLDRLGPPEELESLPLGDLALEAARVMDADLATWRLVFRGKPLAPA